MMNRRASRDVGTSRRRVAGVMELLNGGDESTAHSVNPQPIASPGCRYRRCV
ncbi:hypothetical protein [Larkinella sp. C7]|uniref:hypothetical protein n=1 Tax=Larkinella sp. C7 TaxID=2576607 RepID=UPI0014872C25|nr:hypothetical protein [Larkinella sp. C7]